LSVIHSRPWKPVSPLPDDAEALKALLTLALQKAEAAEQRAAVVEAELANARAWPAPPKR
jgi:hypothetical protein